MSNDPMDFKADRYADKYRDYKQDVKRLELLEDAQIWLNVPVAETPLVEDIFAVCEICIFLDADNPIQSFSDQLTALSNQALAMLEADKKRELERKERTP